MTPLSVKANSTVCGQRLREFRFYARKQLQCFQRVLAIAILYVCPSVCHTGGSVKKRCKMGSPNLHLRLPRRL